MLNLRHCRPHLVCAMVLALLAASCSSASGSESGNYVDVPAQAALSVPGLTTRTASGVEQGGVVATTLASEEPAQAELTSVSQRVFEDVEQFYDDYLQLRGAVIDGSQDIAFIDSIVTTSGQADVASALTYNEDLHAGDHFSAAKSMWLFSNVESISQLDDETILIVDCTEQHEVNRLDQFWILWVTNEIEINVSDGDMRVDSYTTTHNGFLEAEAPLGCAPLSFRERAEAAAARAWTNLALWGRNTNDRTEADLSPVIGGPLRQRLLEDVGDTATLQLDPVREQSSFEAVGLNTLGRLGAEGAEDIVIVVNSCHQFPDGRTGTDIAQSSVVADLPAGAEQALQFQVRLDPSRDDRIDQVLEISYLADRCEA